MKQNGARPAQTRDDIFLLHVIKNGRQGPKIGKKIPVALVIRNGYYRIQ